MKFKAKVREQKTNLGKEPFGRITSRALSEFIGKDVEVEIVEIIEVKG